jgi:hypothetical protein
MPVYDESNQPDPVNRNITEETRIVTISDIEVGSKIDISRLLGRPARGLYIDPGQDAEIIVVLNSLERNLRSSTDVWNFSDNEGAQIRISDTWNSNSNFPQLLVDSFVFSEDLSAGTSITIVAY